MSETRIKQARYRTNQKQVKIWGPAYESYNAPYGRDGDSNMKKMITVLAVLGMGFALAPAVQAGIALPDPGVVGAYRVVFVTSGSPSQDSVSSNMAAMNSWVSGLAIASGLDTAAGSPGWFVVGATTAVDVFTNTGLADTGGVPVYLVDGTAFATDNANLWGLGGQNLNINESGVTGSFGSAIQTGLDDGPITYAGHELDCGVAGDLGVGHGGSDTGFNPWYGNGDTWQGTFGIKSLFAISGVIGGGPAAPTGTLILVK